MCQKEAQSGGLQKEGRTHLALGEVDVDARVSPSKLEGRVVPNLGRVGDPAERAFLDREAAVDVLGRCPVQGRDELGDLS